MIHSRTILILLLAATSLVAQSTSGTAFLIPAPGSQQNTSTTVLDVSGTIAEPGASTPQLNVMGPGSPSTTLAWVDIGSIPSPPATFSMDLGILGAGAQPFVLAVSVTPGVISCGGIVGAPCATGPFLPSSVATPFGQVHLDVTAVPVIDSIGAFGAPFGPPLPAGGLAVSFSFPLADNAVWGRGHVVLQALVVDPTTPAGLGLTAAFSLADWENF